MLRFKDGKLNALTLSYDDGVIQDKRLIEILDKYGIKATFNINSGLFSPEGSEKLENRPRRMTRSEAIELYKGSGHEVAVHCVTHPWIAALNDADILREVYEDRKNLERDFGGIVRGMAYPFGCFNDRVVSALEAAGIAYSRTTVQTERFEIPEDWLRLDSTCHHNNPKLMELADAFINGRVYSNKSRLFYLWGHSYEFDDCDNWNVIEEFAEFVGGRDDVWYATNIEIYDYIQAYRSLQISCDGTVLHNPSGIDLWANINGKDICIKAGETVTL